MSLVPGSGPNPLQRSGARRMLRLLRQLELIGAIELRRDDNGAVRVWPASGGSLVCRRLRRGKAASTGGL